MGAWEGCALPKIAPPEELKFVATLIELFTEAPFLGVTVLGLNEQPENGALLEQVRATGSLNPEPGLGVTVMVTATSVPAFVVTLVGFAVIVKLAGGGGGGGGGPPVQLPLPGAMVPLFNRTLTVPSIELATAISALPSLLKSAAVTPNAPLPAGLQATLVAKVPFPVLSRTIALLPESAMTRSTPVLPSKSAAAIASGPDEEPVL